MSQGTWDLNRRVVVRNLPCNATKEEILNLFERFGSIYNVFIAHNPPGFAFIEYKRRRDAKLAAIEGNGQRCCGSYVRVELTIRDLDKIVVIRNFRRSVTKEEIRDVFDIYGSIEKVWIDRFQQVLAFVEYIRSSDATAAVRGLDGKRCWGCIIRVASPRHPNLRSRHSRYQLRESRNSSIESRSEKRSNRGSRDVKSSTSQCLDCSICKNNTLENCPTSTTCGHIFCETCIKTALLNFGKCPYCRKNLNVNDLIRMYP